MTHSALIAAEGHTAQADEIERRLTEPRTVSEMAARQVLWSIAAGHRHAAAALQRIAHEDTTV